MNLKTQKWIVVLGIIAWIYVGYSVYTSNFLIDRYVFPGVSLFMISVFLLRFIFPFTLNNGTRVPFKKRMGWVFLELTPMLGISLVIVWIIVHYLMPSNFH